MNDFSTALANNFSVVIGAFPDVEFFLTGTSLPSLHMDNILVSGAGGDFPAAGDKILFDPIETTFIVNATYSNYSHIFDTIFDQQNPLAMDLSKVMTTDITVLALDNNKQPIGHWLFTNAFPIALSGIELDTTQSDAPQLTCTITWAYDYFNFETK